MRDMPFKSMTVSDMEPLSNADIDADIFAEDIDIQDIEEQATETAFDLCKNLREVYFNDEYMSNNKQLKKRLDAEIESLRVLIKMRKSDERIHDICVKSVGMHPSNASLYAALTRIQSSLLSIQKQMDETVKNIDCICKNVQLELNFNAPGDDSHDDLPARSPNSHRGSKAFIEQMRNEMDKE